jgi:hypothetical protein
MGKHMALFVFTILFAGRILLRSQDHSPIAGTPGVGKPEHQGLSRQTCKDDCRIGARWHRADVHVHAPGSSDYE